MSPRLFQHLALCAGALSSAVMLGGCGDPVVAWDHLSVINISPPGGASNIAPDVQITATFSADLDDSTVNEETILLEDHEGFEVQTDLSYDDTTFTILMTPLEDLAEGTEYSLALTTGITATSGDPLAANIWSSFTILGATALNDLPNADAGEDISVAVGDTVILDGSGSTDPEGAPLSYAWVLESLPSGSTAVLMSADSATPSFVPDVTGDYVVSLVVSDEELDSDPDYVTVMADQR